MALLKLCTVICSRQTELDLAHVKGDVKASYSVNNVTMSTVHDLAAVYDLVPRSHASFMLTLTCLVMLECHQG